MTQYLKTARKSRAASLALAVGLATTTPAPAKAEIESDALAAAAFFGLVAAVVIAGSHKGQADHAPETDWDEPGWDELPEPLPHEPLPAECQFDIRYGPDAGSWFGQQCLRVSYPDWRALPHHCAWQVELARGRPDITAYDAECLADDGYWASNDWAYR